MTTNKRGFFDAAWDFFCSLKLSIFLLIGLAVTSIIGTVVQQNQPMQQYRQEYAESTIRIFSALGFFDMYHSWWFLLLLYLLTVNLVACSIKRLPRVWKMVTEPTLVFDQGFEKSLALTREFKMSGSAADLMEKMKSFLAGNFSNPVVTEAGGEYHLFAQRSAYSRLGVYVVHFSIIIVFIGAMMGSLFGYKAFVNIVEGTGTSTIYTRSEKQIDLGFTVKCDKFNVSFYDTGAPKEFRSLLTVVDNGKTVIDKRPVIVNDPLTYKGITFYQSSYGPAGDQLFHLTVRERKGGAPVSITARQGEPVKIPGGAMMQVLESTQEVKEFMPGFSGPAARLEVTVPGKAPQAFIVFRDFPDFDTQRGGGQIFTYQGADEKFYTGLQVAKDPGVRIVWLGCTLMVLGIMIAFFMSHKRVWIRTSNGKVVIGGTASKNPAGFELLFDSLVDKLKQL